MEGKDEHDYTHVWYSLHRLRRSGSGGYCNSDNCNNNLGTASLITFVSLLLLNDLLNTLHREGVFYYYDLVIICCKNLIHGRYGYK